jgi:RNA polymerase sigma factor (TIGR02999 family)
MGSVRIFQKMGEFPRKESGQSGDALATREPPHDDLFARVYDELRRLARSKLSKLAPGQTLQATALVNEVYVRLAGKQQQEWANSRHFFFAAARAMHDILVERARAKAAVRRGGDRARLDLDHLVLARESPPDEILALSEAMAELQRHDPRKHELVMLRFFGGCSADQTALAMGLSPRTAQRDWQYARAWLHKYLSDHPG